jgi:hypothetical protein
MGPEKDYFDVSERCKSLARAVWVTNIILGKMKDQSTRTVHIRHQCRKTIVLSCHRSLINTGVEKINYI